MDDSAYMRKVVTQILTRSPFIEVVGTARDGDDALEQVARLQPDLVTLDLVMPGKDGVGFLREQMARRPLPVIIVSVASESSSQVLAALEAGAVDLVQKPTALATEKVFEIAEELVGKVKGAALMPIKRPAEGAAQTKVTVRELAPRGSVGVVAIGISTGGPQGLKQMIPHLPADFPVPILVALHMPVGYTELYARSLDALVPLGVSEARAGEILQAGCVLIAPAGRHLTVRRGEDGLVRVQIDSRPLDTPHRPSIDLLFQSVATVYGEYALGIVMTGMGADGRIGAAWIKAQGGRVWTEAAETCVVYGMPRAVDEAGLSDRQIPLSQIAQALLEVV